MEVGIGLPSTIPAKRAATLGVNEAVHEHVRAFSEAVCDELVFFPSDADPEQVDLLADDHPGVPGR
jgi:hypothetical protein